MMGVCSRCKEMKNLHLSGACNTCRKQIRNTAIDNLRGERDTLAEVLSDILHKTGGNKHAGWELEHAKATALIESIKSRAKFEHKITSQRTFQEAVERVAGANVAQPKQSTVYRHPGKAL